MTTILTNGEYLIGDHRLTIGVNPKSRAIDVNTGGTARLGLLSDHRTKIHLFKDMLSIMHPEKHSDRGVAFGMAGSSIEIDKVLELMRFSSANVIEPRVLGNKIASICNPIGTIGMLILFESGASCTIVLSAMSNIGRPVVKLFPKGKIVSIGSGSTIHKALGDLIPKDITPEELMILSAGSDKHTSPSYSVYGRNENILYSIVRQKSDDVKRRFKEIMTTRLDYQHHKVKIHTNTFKDE